MKTSTYFSGITPPLLEEFVWNNTKFSVGDGTGVLKGHGGGEFTVWLRDGRKFTTNDLWKGERTDEPDFILKLESSYNPFGDIYLSNEDALNILLPLQYQRRLLGYFTGTISKTDLETALRLMSAYPTTSSVDRWISLNLYDTLRKSDKTKISLLNVSSHLTDKDEKLLRDLITGDINSSTLSAIKESTWTFSVTPFQEDLNYLKTYLYTKYHNSEDLLKVVSDFSRIFIEKYVDTIESQSKRVQ